MAELIAGDGPHGADLSRQLLGTTERQTGGGFKLLLLITSAGTLMLFVLMGYTFAVGIGLWGNQIPVAWAFAIINFVWWIGIGHAGTFISAILLLLEQDWRTSINRFAEAMTLFAVAQAALFPLLHLGRPWFAYWLVPYPATMGTWPNVRSPLPWDAAAVTTYGTVSLLFWYVGLLPDLAALRDNASTRRRRILYGIFALGWRGDWRAWRPYRAGYLVLAGLATPLVISVHSVVSSDFATGLTPGWHSTIFPPFFVAGAIFSGFSMVLTLVVPVRSVYKLHNVITERHLDNLAKLTLATGLMVSYGYLVENFLAWYSGNSAEEFVFFHGRPFGPGAAVFWTQMICNVLVVQLLWFRRIRTSPVALFVVSILTQVGMWSERFVIIVMSLQREYLPSQWGAYSPTWVDLGILTGTLCFFGLLFLLFIRYVPFIPVSEVRELEHEMALEREDEEAGRG